MMSDISADKMIFRVASQFQENKDIAKRQYYIFS